MLCKLKGRKGGKNQEIFYIYAMCTDTPVSFINIISTDENSIVLVYFHPRYCLHGFKTSRNLVLLKKSKFSP